MQNIFFNKSTRCIVPDQEQTVQAVLKRQIMRSRSSINSTSSVEKVNYAVQIKHKPYKQRWKGKLCGLIIACSPGLPNYAAGQHYFTCAGAWIQFVPPKSQPNPFPERNKILTLSLPPLFWGRQTPKSNLTHTPSHSLLVLESLLARLSTHSSLPPLSLFFLPLPSHEISLSYVIVWKKPTNSNDISCQFREFIKENNQNNDI